MAITRPDNLLKPFAEDGGRTVIPVASQIGVGDSGAASYTDGFPPLTRTPIAAGGIPPKGLDMNGVLYEATRHIQWLNAGGQARFDAALVTAIGGYPVGVVLQSNDGLSAYVNVVAANATDFNDTPASIGVSWLPYAGESLRRGIISGATFTELDALTADAGPIIATDMAGQLYVWSTSAYFTGYRNPLCGMIPQHFAPTPRAWEMPVTGGVWSDSDPKQKRLIALFREYGHAVAIGDWLPGWERIADLGGGNWKAPDLQNVFLRVAGTDADTANPRGPGVYQSDTIQNITGSFVVRNGNSVSDGVFGAVVTTGTSYAGGTGGAHIKYDFDASRVARTSTETRGPNTAVAAVILV